MANTSSYLIITPESQLGATLCAGMQANLQTLQATHPLWASLLGENNLVKERHIGRDENSCYGIITQSAQGERFLSLTDYQNIEALQNGISPLFDEYETIIFLGTGIGEFLSSTLDFISRLASTELRTRRYIFIEPSIEVFQAVLHFFNFSPLWLSATASFCLGPAWKEQLEFLLQHNPITTRILFAIHPITVGKFTQSAVTILLQHSTEKQIKIWENQYQQIIIAGPKGDHENRRVFDTNFLALHDSLQLHYPQDRINCITSASIPFFKNSEGSVSVSFEQTSKLTLTYSDQEQQRLKNWLDDNYLVTNTYLLLGGGDASLLKTILDRTVYYGQWSGYEQVVYLVEPSVELFIILLHLLDITEYIQRNRLIMFVGPTATTDFSTYLKTQEFARIPDQLLSCCYYQESELFNQIISDCKALRVELVEDARKLRSDLSAYYDSLPLSYWKDRFSNSSSLTIVGFTTRRSSFAQYCTRDFLNGFAQRGHQTLLLIEPDGTTSFRENYIVEKLNAIKPDIFFIINHLRDEYPWIPKKMPFICWIQDLLPNLMNYGNFIIQKFDFTYIIDKSWEKILKKNTTFKQSKMNVLPLACNEQVYHKIHGIKKKYDISYITHLVDPNSTFHPFAGKNGLLSLNKKEHLLIREKKISEGELLNTYSIIMRELNSMGLTALTAFVAHQGTDKKKKFLQALIHTRSIRNNIFLINYLITGASRLFCHILFLVKSLPIRHFAAHGFQVAVWGNNWNLIPELAAYAQGVAENGCFMNQVQNESRICLNNSGGISFHMRALEILASGAFMLSRRIKNDGVPITDYLKEGEEVILFNDERDLLEKAEYYLRHENERERIAQKAMEKAIANFSYHNTSERLLQDMKNKILDF